MSLFSKFIGGGFIPLAFAHHQTQKRQRQNECHTDAHALQDAEALQKIFEEGG
jgi:hypothetical protein